MFVSFFEVTKRSPSGRFTPWSGRRCRRRDDAAPTAPDDPGFEPVFFIGVDVLAERHYLQCEPNGDVFGA